MTNIGRKIIKSLKDFKDSLVRGDISTIELMTVPQYEVEYQPYNCENSNMSSREMYLENCRQENSDIRKEYGPMLVTYIRRPQTLMLPRHKLTNDELIKYYRENFQNTPIGCVVAIRVDGEIHYGWSLCNKKDRFNKVISLNRALNRAISGDGGFAEYENCPPLVADYLDTLAHRANKYFNKSATA